MKTKGQRKINSISSACLINNLIIPNNYCFFYSCGTNNDPLNLISHNKSITLSWKEEQGDSYLYHNDLKNQKL